MFKNFDDHPKKDLFISLLKKQGSNDIDTSVAASKELAAALEDTIRKGVLSGPILDGVFQVINLEPGSVPKFPLDMLAPGTEKDYVGYTVPAHGYIPQRTVEGDYVMLNTYRIANSIDWLLEYSLHGRVDVAGRAMQILEAGFTKKLNDDGFHTLLAAGVDRNIVVYDADASNGQFTKRLVSLMKTVMRRNGGGNSTSVNRRKLTDMYLSPEGLEDIRNWGVDIVDEQTRREIFLAADGQVNRIFGVNLHDLDELGEGQEYQLFYTNQLSGTLASGDVELVVGLDLSSNDSFKMPVSEKLGLFPDPALHRHQKAGWYGWMGMGVGVMDNRLICLGSF